MGLSLFRDLTLSGTLVQILSMITEGFIFVHFHFLFYIMSTDTVIYCHDIDTKPVLSVAMAIKPPEQL